MALDDAQVIGTVDDPVEEGEFRVLISGIGEIDMNEVSPLGQFETARIMRDYGGSPTKVKTLSSKITFEPVKFTSYALINDPTLRELVDGNRPRRGKAGTSFYQIQVYWLDRDGNNSWGYNLIDCIIYSVPGQSAKAGSSDPAKFEFMADPNDWEYSDLQQ